MQQESREGAGTSDTLFWASPYILRLDILQKPVRGDLVAQALFFGGAEGRVAHGGELDAGAHVI